MMYSKQEKQMLQLIAATVLLGIFSLNPIARAEGLDGGVSVVEKTQDRMNLKGDRLDRAPAVSARQEPLLPASLQGRSVIQVSDLIEALQKERADRTPAQLEAPTREERVEVMREERDGISLSDLNKILREPLAVKPNETNTNVSFLGDVPARCVYNSKGEMTASIDYDKFASKDGQHVFRVHMPLCENDPTFKRKAGEKMVRVSEIPGARAMNDVKGKIVLASGYKDSDSEPTLEDIKSKSGSVVEIQTQALAEAAADRARMDKSNEAQRKQDEENRKHEQKIASLQIEKTAKNVEAACKENDFETVDSSLGNYPDLREHVKTIARRQLLKDIEKAEAPDSAQEAWEAFSAASEKFDWEESDVKKGRDAYVSKRFALIDAEVSGLDDSETKPDLRKAEKMVDEWAKDFKELDSRVFAKRKDDIARIYGNIAAAAANGASKKNVATISKAVADAERNLNKAKRYSSSANVTQAEGLMAKINGQAFASCVKSDPAHMVECENKFRDKVRTHGESYVARLQKQSENGDESAAAEVQAFASDYLRAEGYGATASYQGFGTIHQAPGYFEQTKIQSLQEMQMRMQQQYMQQMMGGGM
ncbi:MAG: hypothetical protein ACXWQO_18000, partial [Bdellovibrionota bacterium]